MCNSLMRIVLVLAAGGLLGLLGAPPESVGPRPKQVSDGPAQPAPEAQPPARIDAKQPSATLFKNVKVFDGKSAKLTASTSVLVVGNKIKKIGADVRRRAHLGCRLRQPGGRRGGHGHAAARVHHRSRRWWADVRAQARH